jgi:hypothetical protein
VRLTFQKRVLDDEALDTLAMLQIVGLQVPPIAAARHERRLLAVACKPGLKRLYTEATPRPPHERLIC